VKWLFEDQGNNRGRIISASKPIPVKGSDEDKDDQPPHRQAANYYKGVVNDKNGEFKVTMEHPSKNSPKPLEFEIDVKNCLKRILESSGAATFPYSKPTPRAGQDE
jgi:hypothetical protein